MNLSTRINKEIESLTDSLTNHSLYSHLSNLEDVKVFTQYHVFAVWDFMSLLKSLQNSLTCITIPWLPNDNSQTARFINEIVVGEETDLNYQGIFKSHFDMYIDAMNQIGSDTSQVLDFLRLLKNDYSVSKALNIVNVDPIISEFVNFTFKTINTKKIHVIASVFTFGREGLIADMFIEILKHSSHIDKVSCNEMIYYLERHIELDGDEHGPMAMKMIEELCQNDEEKILEVIQSAKEALNYRLKLWDRISVVIQNNKSID